MGAKILLLRHCDTIDRKKFAAKKSGGEFSYEADLKRPLSKFGKAQALRLVRLARRFGVNKIFTSPAKRAKQSIKPMAKALGLKPVVVPKIAPDAGMKAYLDFILSAEFLGGKYGESLKEIRAGVLENFSAESLESFEKPHAKYLKKIRGDFLESNDFVDVSIDDSADDSTNNIPLLVGHNDDLEQAVARLTNAKIPMPKGALVCLDIPLKPKTPATIIAVIP